MKEPLSGDRFRGFSRRERRTQSRQGMEQHLSAWTHEVGRRSLLSSISDGRDQEKAEAPYANSEVRADSQTF